MPGAQSNGPTFRGHHLGPRTASGGSRACRSQAQRTVGGAEDGPPLPCKLDGMIRMLFPGMFWPLAMAFGLACVASVTLGFSAAIAAPSAYLAWFKAYGGLQLGRMLWDLVVVGGLGLGLPAFVAALAAFRLGAARVTDWLLFTLAALLFILFFLPWLQEGTRFGKALASVARPWWGYGVELSLLLATLTARAKAGAR